MRFGKQILVIDRFVEARAMQKQRIEETVDEASKPAIHHRHTIHESIEDRMRFRKNRIAGVTILLEVRQRLRDTRCRACHNLPNLMDRKMLNLLIRETRVSVRVRFLTLYIPETPKTGSHP